MGMHGFPLCLVCGTVRKTSPAPQTERQGTYGLLVDLRLGQGFNRYRTGIWHARKPSKLPGDIRANEPPSFVGLFQLDRQVP